MLCGSKDYHGHGYNYRWFIASYMYMHGALFLPDCLKAEVNSNAGSGEHLAALAPHFVVLEGLESSSQYDNILALALILPRVSL